MCHKADTSNVSPECMLKLLTILRHHTQDKAHSRTETVPSISRDKILILTAEDGIVTSLSRACNGNSRMAPSSSSSNNSRTVASTRQRLTRDNHPEIRTSHHKLHRTVDNRLENKTSRHNRHLTADSRPETRTRTHRLIILHNPGVSTVLMIFFHPLKIFKIRTIAINYFHVLQTIGTKVIVV